MHAIVYLLVPLLDGKLDKGVYSYRLHSDWEKRAKKRDSMFHEGATHFPFLKKKTIRAISPFEAWYELWPEFEAEAIRACTEEGYTHLTKTDITAYFENIDLRLLETQIRSLLKREENRVLQVLFRVLEGWTRVTSTGTPVGRGIPQGNEIGSFLGNLYLVPLDRALIRFCKTHDAKWFRYVDDVKVFTKSEKDARDAVFVVNHALRSLHLNLQGSKTDILSGERLEHELDDSEEEQVDEAYKEILKLDRRNPQHRSLITKHLKPLKPLVSKFRCGLPGSVAKLDGKQSRLFRRLMTLYGRCGRPHFRKAAVAAMTQLPDLRILKKTLSYLTQLEHQVHDSVFNEIMGLVETDELPFPYQAGMVLETVAALHPCTPNVVASRIRKYAFIKKRDWFVVQKAVEALFAFPWKAKYAQSVAERCLKHRHFMVRRAACTLLLRSPKHHVRNRLGELIYDADPSISRLALFFLRFVQDKQFALDEISRMKKGSTTDLAFLFNLPKLYAIAATEEKTIAAAVTA